MFSFVATSPTEEEWEAFLALLEREVEYSLQMEEMLHNTRQKNRKHYYMLEKQLVLKEMKTGQFIS